MNCPRPRDGECEVQSIKFFVAKVTLVDLHEDDSTAVTVSRQRIELTGAAIGAAAVGEHLPMNFPIGHVVLRPK